MCVLCKTRSRKLASNFDIRKYRSALSANTTHVCSLKPHVRWPVSGQLSWPLLPTFALCSVVLLMTFRFVRSDAWLFCFLSPSTRLGNFSSGHGESTRSHENRKMLNQMDDIKPIIHAQYNLVELMQKLFGLLFVTSTFSIPSQNPGSILTRDCVRILLFQELGQTHRWKCLKGRHRQKQAAYMQNRSN